MAVGAYYEITKSEPEPINTVVDSAGRGSEAKSAFRMAVKQLLPPKKKLEGGLTSRYEQGSKAWTMDGAVSSPDELGVVREQPVSGKLVYFRSENGMKWVLLELLLNGVEIQSNSLPKKGDEKQEDKESGGNSGTMKEETKPFMSEADGPGFLGLGVAGVLFGVLHLAVVLEQLKSRHRDSLWKLKIATEAFDRGQIEHAQELLTRLQQIYPGSDAAKRAHELSLQIERDYPPTTKA